MTATLDKKALDCAAEAAHKAKLRLCWGPLAEGREPWARPNAASPAQPWHDIAYAMAEAAVRVYLEEGEARDGR